SGKTRSGAHATTGGLMNAKKHVGTFRMDCAISIPIAATPQKIWDLLTDAKRFSQWNTTVESIEGEIAEGRKLKIKVPSSPGRVFGPRVSNVEPGRAMTWSDGFAPMFKGVRTFSLEPNGDGT